MEWFAFEKSSEKSTGEVLKLGCPRCGKKYIFSYFREHYCRECEYQMKVNLKWGGGSLVSRS